MRYALLSDVHSNLEALNAVLEDVYKKKITEILFLGDAVGYGPDPNECVALLAKKCNVLLAGNHDWGAIGLTSISYFNEYARDAIEWTRNVLTEDIIDILRSFPVSKEINGNDILLVHSTPREPEEWHYIFTLRDAEINFNYFNNRICFIGHSHHPFIIEKVLSGELITYRDEVRIKEGNQYIVNVGSVGQPRDGDPRACYAILDNAKMEIIRVPYNIKRVQSKMKKERLPFPLIERLLMGR